MKQIPTKAMVTEVNYEYCVSQLEQTQLDPI